MLHLLLKEGLKVPIHKLVTGMCTLINFLARHAKESAQGMLVIHYHAV